MTPAGPAGRRRGTVAPAAYSRWMNSEDNRAESDLSEPPPLSRPEAARPKWAPDNPASEPPVGTSDDNEVRAEAAEILSAAPALVKWLLIYSLLRIALVIALTAVLYLVMPLIVALLFAVVLALPLSFVIFAGTRRRVNAVVAISTARRRNERERLRAALHGEDQ